jgi:hypothetical protein
VSTVAVVGWVDVDFVFKVWPEAEDLDEAVLTSYLMAAFGQAVEFLPPVDLKPYPETIPDTWKQAQIMQARALHRSNVAGSGDQMGGDGLTVTVFPMDWTVKNLLRPKRIGRVL